MRSGQRGKCKDSGAAARLQRPRQRAPTRLRGDQPPIDLPHRRGANRCFCRRTFLAQERRNQVQRGLRRSARTLPRSIPIPPRVLTSVFDPSLGFLLSARSDRASANVDSDCGSTQGFHKPIHLERRNCQKAYSAPIPDIEKAPVRGLDFWFGGKRYHTASK